MEKIIKLLESLRKLAKVEFGVDVPFSVEFNNRLTSTAGRAFYETGRIELSKKLYEQNVEAFFADTIPHEFCHLVAYRAFNECGHGPMWKHVMRTMGYEPTRCHSYEVQKRSSAKTYKFKCSCREWDFSPQRMAWVRKGRIYKCPECGDFCKEVV